MRETIIWKVDPQAPLQMAIEQAASILRHGGLVAFPTETVYGLGANGLDGAAVNGIFAAKGRPADNPLILHIADQQDLAQLVSEVPQWLPALLDTCWPGPLSVVLRRSDCVPDQVTAGLDTVAVRLPDSAIARELIRAAGVPVAAPSANASGRPSPTSADAVLDDLKGKIDGVIDAGPCLVGVESTVLDCTRSLPVILRPGGVTYEMLEKVLGKVGTVAGEVGIETDVPRSPGMKYRHYAPNAPLHLVEAALNGQETRLLEKVYGALDRYRSVGAIVTNETALKLPAGIVTATYGSRANPSECAAGLYLALRKFDNEPVDVIIAEGIPEVGIGRAFMNRLRKAATSTMEE